MKISVVTAAWNSAATVRDTLESVLAQELGDAHHGEGDMPKVEVEHIVVDGGSTDGTVEIVRQMEARYRERYGEGSLRWVSEKDKGIYDAMNKGILMATGDVVGILNSDDFYTSHHVLARVARELTQPQWPATAAADGGEPDPNGGRIDAVYGDIHYVDDDDLTRCVRYYSSKGFRRWKMRFGYMPAHPSFYCMRDVYCRHGLFDTDLHVAADFEQLLRLIYINNLTTRYVPMDFVTMRTGGASTSGLRSHRRILREHLLAYRKNGITSGVLHESVRYACKGTALVWYKLLSKLGLN